MAAADRPVAPALPGLSELWQERSPMAILPFRVPPNSQSDVKALVDWRLSQDQLT
jgi:hypothetical protein